MLEPRILQYFLFNVIGYALNLNLIPQRDVPGTFCEKETSCLNTSDFSKLPYCYCDTLCNRYRDCCRFKSETDPDQFDIKDNDPLSRSTCLKVGNDAAGVWIVNRCGHFGEVCSDQVDSSKFVLQPPVTGSDHLPYLNADCAACNNVTNYKTWHVSFSGGEVSSLLSSTDESFTTEDAFQSDFRNPLSKLKNVKLIPTKDTLLRVCYGKSESFNSCTKYQHPVYGDNYELFKNEQCCRKAGSIKCELLGEDKDSCRQIFATSILDARHSLDSYIKDASVILQFAESEPTGTAGTTCNKNEKDVCTTENCNVPKEHCLPKILKIYGYRIKTHFLTFISNFPYDIEAANVAFQAFNTLLKLSTWRIHLLIHGLTGMPILEGKNCTNYNGVCVTMQRQFRSISQSALTIQDALSLELWLANLQFEVKIHSPYKIFTRQINGSFSTSKVNSSNCMCAEKRHLRAQHFIETRKKLIPVASSFPHSCGVYILTVTVDHNMDDKAEKLCISCNGESAMENNARSFHFISSFVVIAFSILMKFEN